MVGRVLQGLLEKRAFPAGRLLLFSSGARRDLNRCPAPSLEALLKCDLVFLVSSDEVSMEFAPRLAAAGVWVIDDSSAFRMAPDVPLVIPEVNAGSLSESRRLVSGPNCTLTGAAVAGAAIMREAGVKALRLASYQAVSGAGKAALEEFHSQTRSSAVQWKNFQDLPSFPVPKALPRPIALNLFPQVGGFDAYGESLEESKIRNELRKIWSMPDLPVSATAVRVPVARCHSLALWIETHRPISQATAEKALSRQLGMRLWNNGDYPTPADAAGTDPVHVGRVRQGTSDKELALWVVCDNLLKGAALNSIQIAEILIQKGWLRAG
jgi:aspartate-semialdehyde dehydrogenase